MFNHGVPLKFIVLEIMWKESGETVTVIAVQVFINLELKQDLKEKIIHIVDNGPVQEKANLCNEQRNEIAMRWVRCTGTPVSQVFRSLQGCITSRTGPLSTLNKTNQVMYWKIFFRCHNY